MNARENNMRLLLSEVARQDVILSAKPLELHLGLSNICNLNCSFCTFKGFSYKPVSRAVTLPISVIEKLVPFFPTARYCSPSSQGEPFLYPHLEKFIELAHDNALFEITHLLNNATQIHRFDSHKLRGINIVAFSIDAGTKELFELLRYGADFEEVVRNVKDLREALPDTMLQFSAVINRLNVNHIDDVFTLAQELGINYLSLNAVYGHERDPVIQLLRLRDSDEQLFRRQMEKVAVANQDQKLAVVDFVQFDGFEDGATLDEAAIQEQLLALKNQTPSLDYDMFNADNPEYYKIKPKTEKAINRPRLPYCIAPFCTMNIAANGHVHPCCAQFADIDDLSGKSAEEVWNGEAYLNLREAMFDYQRLPEACKVCNTFPRYVHVDALWEHMQTMGLSIDDIEIPPNYNPQKDAIKNPELCAKIEKTNQARQLLRTLSPGGSPTMDTWNSVAKGYALEIDAGEAELAKEMISLLEAKGILRGSRLLELGSGSGHLSACLAMAGYHTTLLDFSSESMDKARQTYAYYKLEGEFVLGDIMALDDVLSDMRYDLVWSSGLMEHFDDESIVHAFQATHTLLCDNLLVLVPNPSSISYLLMRYTRMAQNDWPYGKEYLRQNYEKILRCIGYHQIETAYFALRATEHNFRTAMQGTEYGDAYAELLNRNLLPESEKYLIGFFARKNAAGAGFATSEKSLPSVETQTQLFDVNAERYGLSVRLAKFEARYSDLACDLDRKGQTIRALNANIAKKDDALTEKETQIACLSAQIEDAHTALAENQAAISSAKGLLFGMMGSATFRVVHFWARFKYQLLMGNTAEKKGFFRWLRHRNSIGDGRVYNPLKRVYDALDTAKARAFGGAGYELLSAETKMLLAAPYQKFDVIMLGVIPYAFRYQRPQHLAAQFAAAGHRVIYVDPIFASEGRLRRQSEKLYLVNLENNLHSDIYQTAWAENTDDLAKTLNELMGELCVRDALVLVDYPNWLLAARCLRHNYGFTILTDYMDDFTGFSATSDRIPELAENCKTLLRESHGVVASSQFLYNIATQYNERTTLVRNGTEAAFFETAFTPVSVEGGRKIIGYYGAIAEWFDAEKVCYLADALPDCDIVLIGEVTAHKTQLERHSNIRLLGEKPYEELPEYLKSFDVCLIPFDTTTDLIKATNPVKFYEYLSAGKKVVATEIPELESYRGEYAYLANDDKAFADYVKLCLDGFDDLADPEKCRSLGRENDWGLRYRQVEEFSKALFPLISIVLLTYNNLPYTKACIHSVLDKTAWPRYELIAVDNASTDGTPEYLKSLECDTRVKVFLNDDNLGFAAGNNVGIKASCGDYVVLLNNDTLVTRGWLSAMIKHLEDDPKMGMCGPVTNSIGNEAKIIASYHSLEELDYFAELNARRNAGKRYSAPGALAMFCVCIRRQALNECGLLDERYTTGMFEDDDYAMAVRAKGYELCIAEDSFVHHFDGASFSKIETEARRRLFEINKELFEEKWNCRWKHHRYRAGVGWETDSDLKHELEAEN